MDFIQYKNAPDSSSEESSVLESSELDDDSSELLVYSLLSDSLSVCGACYTAGNSIIVILCCNGCMQVHSQ